MQTIVVAAEHGCLNSIDRYVMDGNLGMIWLVELGKSKLIVNKDVDGNISH